MGGLAGILLMVRADRRRGGSGHDYGQAALTAGFEFPVPQSLEKPVQDFAASGPKLLRPGVGDSSECQVFAGIQDSSNLPYPGENTTSVGNNAFSSSAFVAVRFSQSAEASGTQAPKPSIISIRPSPIAAALKTGVP